MVEPGPAGRRAQQVARKVVVKALEQAALDDSNLLKLIEQFSGGTMLKSDIEATLLYAMTMLSMTQKAFEDFRVDRYLSPNKATVREFSEAVRAQACKQT